MDFMIKNKIVTVDEPYVVITAYGSFHVPDAGRGNDNFIIVKYPSGRQPWSKKIAPAIEKLIRPWFDTDVPARERRWNVDGEGIHIGEGCFYTDGRPMPECKKRLWDCDTHRRFEWNGEQLVEVMRGEK